MADDHGLDPKLLAILEKELEHLDSAVTRAFYVQVTTAAQEVFDYATTFAEHGPEGPQAMRAAILEAAWALAAAHAEDQMVRREAAGQLVGVDERLTSMAFSVRKVYYPFWRFLLEGQGKKTT